MEGAADQTKGIVHDGLNGIRTSVDSKEPDYCPRQAS